MNISRIRQYGVNFGGNKLYLPYEKVAHTIERDVKSQIEVVENIYGKSLVLENVMEKIYSKGAKIFRDLGLKT